MMYLWTPSAKLLLSSGYAAWKPVMPGYIVDEEATIEQGYEVYTG